MPSNRVGPILVLVVTFNPDLDLLEKGLGAISTQVPDILLVDNGSRNVGQLRALAGKLRVEMIANSTNIGLAAGLNAGFEFAVSRDFEWVLTLDQDSVAPPGLVDSYCATLNSLNDEDVAILCPNFRDRATREVAYSVQGDPMELEKCITSGSMNRTRDWRDVSGFDEAMFIDGVDFDYCMRIRRMGKQIILLPAVVLEHEIGASVRRRFLWHPIIVMGHPPVRKYYIAQNIIYVSGKYSGGHPSLTAYLKVARQVFLVLLYESEKREKVASIFRGVRSGQSLLEARRG